MTIFDLDTVDELLTTTRAVRKRLDLERPVSRETIETCLRLAIQAPTGSNRQGWRWLVITDANKRSKLADIYRRGADSYLDSAHNAALAAGDAQNARVYDSARYLANVLQDVPVHVIPCIENHVGEANAGVAWSGIYGSIYPAVWSFQLALRSRGLGSCITTLHLRHHEETATLLGIPEGFMQVALLPVAYTVGNQFKPAARNSLESIAYFDTWEQGR
jgi:nitroreductase